MKAIVYHGPGNKAFEERPKPTLQKPTDAIVKVVATTICGSDLHILRGDVPAVTEGRILGHEGVGVVEEVGSAVSSFAPGQRVVISCITSCGRCPACKKGMYSHCVDGGWILGHRIDGTQAGYVRVPHADNSLYAAPKAVDDAALVMLSDILPTGFEIGVRKGQVQPGDAVAIIGGGPVGLAALMTAQLYSPAELIVVDVDPHRLAAAQTLGATKVVDSSDGRAVERILELTSGRGVDVAIEAVGVPATFDICQGVVAAGGHLANIGVHGTSVALELQKLWTQNVTITTGLVDTNTTAMLLRSVVAGRLAPSRLVSHELGFDEMLKAYELFEHAATSKALKIVLRARD
jgi:alcohol dehydrogenase